VTPNISSAWPAHDLRDLVFHRDETELCAIRGDKLTELVAREHGITRAGDKRVKFHPRVFGGADRTEKTQRISHSPGDEDRNDDVALVERERLGDARFVEIEPRIEALHGLERPGQPRV
jgi:hypothetical protein